MGVEHSVVDSDPLSEDIVRSAWQHADSGGNDQRLDLAWAAGFFDGEGYVGINPARRSSNPNNSYTLAASLGQVGREPVQRFASIVGGKTYRYERYSKSQFPVSLWSCGGQVAASALRLMYPYLFVKKEQVGIALEFQDSKGHTGGRPLTDDQIAVYKSYSDKLKQLRWEIKANS